MRTIVFTPPEKRVAYHPPSSAERLISWVWPGKQKHRDLKWKDFSPVTLCLYSPWGCVQVGLEMVKYNGCSVWPEDRKACISLTLGNQGSTERLPQFVSSQLSSQRKWVSNISTRRRRSTGEQHWFRLHANVQRMDQKIVKNSQPGWVFAPDKYPLKRPRWRPCWPPTLRTDWNASDGLCFPPPS